MAQRNQKPSNKKTPAKKKPAAKKAATKKPASEKAAAPAKANVVGKVVYANDIKKSTLRKRVTEWLLGS